MSFHDGPISNNRQRRNFSENVRGLNALGNLSSIIPESRPAVPLSSSYLQPYSTSPVSLNMAPPPLPPRRSQYMSSYNRYNGLGMSGYYSPYSHSYSPYRSYGMPYGPYGAHQNQGYNSFVQMAEESTRPAFESIESVVEVVSSISMMLESTYQAVHSSYSAILGVADQFSRLKDHLAQILSVLALYRGIRWLCLKFLYLLRLRKENPSVEAAWNSATQVGPTPGSPVKTEGSAWPFLMFVSLVIGAPWLMFKLLSKNVAKRPIDQSIFLDESGKRFVAYAAYDFNGTQRNELSFQAGEKLFISPKSYRSNPKGWYLACNEKQQTGMVPSNYLASRSKTAGNDKPPITQAPGSAANASMPRTDNNPIPETAVYVTESSETLPDSSESGQNVNDPKVVAQEEDINQS